MTVIGALGSPSTPLCSWMPATSLAALLVRDRLGLRAAGGGDRDAGDDQDDRDAGGAEQVADAATAGLGGDGRALGGPALLAQLALGLRHLWCSFEGSGLLAC